MKERCEDCKDLEEDIYWKHFQSIQFCQFLTGDFHSQLMIPEKFSQKLGERLRQNLGLRGPSGINWDVQLKICEDVLYFGNGWGNFVEAHCLVEKDILIFKYSGGSQFDVLMFEGSSFCEKESSYFVRKCGHTKKTEYGSNSPRTALKEISMEIIQEHSTMDPVENAFQKKKSLLGEPEFDGARGEFSPNKAQARKPVKLTGLQKIPMTKGKGTTHQSSDFIDKDDEPELAGVEDEFSQNPSRVRESVKLPGSKQTSMGEVITTPYHLSSESNQRPVTEAMKLPDTRQIPIREGKTATYKNTHFNDMKNASDDEPESAGAEDEFGQNSSHVWEPVKFSGSNQKPEFACGRNEFSPNPAQVWEPVKLPGSEQIPMREGKCTALQKFHLSDTKNASDDEPEFAGTEDEFSHNPSQVWEPVKLPGSKQTPTGEGTSTPYHLSNASNRMPATEAVKLPGSKQIPKKDGKSKAYHNSPLNASDDEPDSAGAEDEYSQNPSQVWEPVNLPGSNASNRSTMTRAQKVAAIAAMRLASKELSESKGSFRVVMRSTHVSKKFYMNIPTEWAMANGVQVRQDVILRTKERSWNTKLIFGATGRGGISRGWRDFVVDNRLEEFDVCVFKLASQNQKPLVLDVSIIKVVPEVAPLTCFSLEPSSSKEASAVNKRKFSQLEDDVPF